MGSGTTAWRRSPLTAVVVVVSAACAAPFLVRGVGLPLGPDAPVYLWWYRLVEIEGLDVVSKRPGALALALVSRGPFAMGAAPAVIALEIVTAVAVGVAMAILAERAGVVSWWGRAVSGILSGLLAFGLSAGWISNAVFAVCFLGALVLLSDERRGPTVAGPAVALGAATIAHPLFFVLGATTLAAAAGIGWLRGDRAWARTVVAAVAFAGVLAAAALLWARTDSVWVDLPTSGDGLFRAAGLSDLLRDRYWEGFFAQWGRGLWLALPIPLVLLGLARGRSGRILGVWVALCLAAVPLFLATGIAPAARLPRWAAIALPVFLVLAVERVARGEFSSASKKLLVGAGALIVLGLVLAAALGSPTFTRAERAAIEGGWKEPSPDGAPIVAFVGYEPIQPANRVVEAWNELRATVPAARIRDVYAFYGTPEDLASGRTITSGNRVDEALSRRTLAWIEQRGSAPPGAGRSPSAAPGSEEELLQPASRADVLLAMAWFALVWILAGWSWAPRDVEPIHRAAVASLLGAPLIVWGGFLVDRLGFRLASPAGAGAALAFALLLSWVLGRGARRSAGQVDGAQRTDGH